jgi:hypothetical protein
MKIEYEDDSRVMEGRIMGGRIIETAALLPRPFPMILPTMILPTKSALGMPGLGSGLNFQHLAA